MLSVRPVTDQRTQRTCLPCVLTALEPRPRQKSTPWAMSGLAGCEVEVHMVAVVPAHGKRLGRLHHNAPGVDEAAQLGHVWEYASRRALPKSKSHNEQARPARAVPNRPCARPRRWPSIRAKMVCPCRSLAIRVAGIDPMGQGRGFHDARGVGPGDHSHGIRLRDRRAHELKSRGHPAHGSHDSPQRSAGGGLAPQNPNSSQNDDPADVVRACGDTSVVSSKQAGLPSTSSQLRQALDCAQLGVHFRMGMS
jgi:hypothetical protein